MRDPHPLQEDEVAVPSGDGSDAYIFSLSGRHRRTVDTGTNRTLYEFSYTEDGLLDTIRDIDGLVTTIERDSNGRVQRIIGPWGHTHELLLHDEGTQDGYLAGLVAPGGLTWQFEYYNPDEHPSCKESGENCQSLMRTFVEPGGAIREYARSEERRVGK